MKNNLRRYCLSGKDTGSVVVLTLWTVVFLALLASAIASSVAAHLRVASDIKWGAVSRSAEMYALASAMKALQSDKTATYDALFEEWADHPSFKDVPFGGDGGGHYSLVHEEEGKRYGLADEDGKINLNRAPSHVLSLLFRAVGMTSVAAEDLANFIVDWRDVDTIGEGKAVGSIEACTSLSAPYGCKNDDFEVLEELWLMPEMTSSLYNSIRDELTLYGSGVVNINTARALALRAVGLTEEGAERVISWRNHNGNFFENPGMVLSRMKELGLSDKDRIALSSATSAGLLGTSSDAFRGQIETNLAGRLRRGATFVINRKGEVKSWRE